MGSWNSTCAVSNLHVTAGEEVVVFMLLENKESRTFCYGNALFDVCPVPFYGKYNDYGAVEDCHGLGLNIVIEAIREKLYKFGQGPNSVHDCEVNKENFDIDMLFEADHQDRLGVEHFDRWSKDEYELNVLEQKKDSEGLTDAQQFELDRLASKIKKVDNFRRVTHVIIHGKVFKAITEKWYIEDYVGDGKGDKGHGNNYRHLYFKDMLDSIPEYMRRTREHYEKAQAEIDAMSEADKASSAAFRRIMRSMRSEIFEWNDPCMAGQWMEYFRRDSSSVWGLISVHEFVNGYIEAKDWTGLESFVKEVLTAAWVNSFMSHTRKIWTKQTGAGSQNSEHLGYQVLAESVLDILKEEKAKYDYDMGEDDQMDLFYDDPNMEDDVADIEEDAAEYFLPQGPGHV